MAITLSIAPESVNLTKNQVLVRLTSSNYSQLVNYRAVLRILLEKTYNSNTFVQVAEIEAIPDSNGFSSFYIERILDTELQLCTPFRVPDLENPHPYACETTRRFRIQYLEKYGDPQQGQTPVTSSNYVAIIGGVDAHYAGLFNFFENVDEDNALLSYMPGGKTIGRNHAEVITFLNHTGATKYFGLAVNEYNSAGVQIGTTTYLHTGVADAPEDAVPLAPWWTAVFPVGTDKLTIDENAAYYTVQVFEMNINTQQPVAAQSQVVTYYLGGTHPYPAQLIWFGSFHNPHVLRCTGRKRTRLLVERQLSDRIVTWGLDPHLGATIQHARSFNHQYTYRTGAVSQDEADALQEMLIENKVLEHTPSGSYHRLVLTDSSYDILEQRSTPAYLEFAANRSLSPLNYMKLRKVQDEDAETDVWELNNNGYWELNTGSGFWQLN